MQKEMKNDKEGRISHFLIKPLLTEFQNKDIMQIVVGAFLLAIPIGFTEETWRLGQTLPILNTLMLLLFTLVFISIFVYYYYHHRKKHENHPREFLKRVLSTYLISAFIGGIFLTIIQQAPWNSDFLLAIKRTIIIAFPASIGAAITDALH